MNTRPLSRCLAALLGTAALGVTASCHAAPTTPAALRESAGEARAVVGPLLTGHAALGGWSTDAPGVRRKLTLADLPAPYATRSVDNGPGMIRRPSDAWPKAPAGFRVELFADRLRNPRKIVTAPNGDLFIAESGANRIEVLRPGPDGKPALASGFAADLRQPFGIAFYPTGPTPKYVYVGNTDSVVRFPYRNGDTTARGPEEMVVPDIPGGGRLRGGGHWTRDVVFSRDNSRMFVSVGSHSNDSDDALEYHRADILEYTPGGRFLRVFASGIRNAVGLAINPKTGAVWGSVNERDELGDNLVPDYITEVKPGGFYGWPWYYMGGHQDPRHRGEHPELAGKVLTPDVLLQSHMASLAMTFYTGHQFPAKYDGWAFAAQHGSWNRTRRNGYKVVAVPIVNGRATGEYDDFLTGFVTDDGVWGRPVGVTVGKDGSLYVTDDGSNAVWRVSYARPTAHASRR